MKEILSEITSSHMSIFARLDLTGGTLFRVFPDFHL
jgi:hypothetical protein